MYTSCYNMDDENRNGNDQAKKPGFSFGFKKKVETKKLHSAALGETDNTQVNETDFVTSLEGQEVKSSKPKEEKKEFVIPLIKNNNWRKLRKPEDFEKDDTGDNDKKQKAKETKPCVSEAVDNVESQAVKEILEDAARQEEEKDKVGKLDPDHAIPLLMCNQVPEGYETEANLDVSLRPDEPESADYEEVPIEEFGFALLRGMGWKEGQGIGKNNAGQPMKPIQAVLRPKGLGLGADRSHSKQAVYAGDAVTVDKEDESLVLKKGACCIVKTGKHKDLYGMVEGVDEDNARVVIKMALGGHTVTLTQYAITLVNKKDYDKYSKYLNKNKVDKFKEEEAKKSKSRHRDTDSGSESDRHRHRDRDRQTDRHRDKDRHRDRDRESRDRRDRDDRDRNDKERRQDKHRHRDRREDRRRDRDEEQSRQSQDRDEEGDVHRNKHREKRKHEEQSDQSSKKSKSSGSSTTMNGSSSVASPWLRPNLRVRVVDPQYKNGNYFKTKVVIEDVITQYSCICRTSEGKVLEDISQSMLETVIPKTDPGYVMVIKGKHKEQLGEVLKRDKTTCRATVQPLKDRDQLLVLDYDSICEYTGNIDLEFDY